MKISIVSDEISRDFPTSVELATDWGIKNFEIRVVASGRIPNIPKDYYENMLHTIEAYKINITAISPGLFKGPLSESKEIEIQIKKVLPKCFQCAQDVKTDKIIVFGFLKPEQILHKDYPEKLIDIFKKIAELAEKEKITIMIENELNSWIGEGEVTKEILMRINSQYLKLNWDPANSFKGDGEIFVEEYKSLKDFIVNIHIKDIKPKVKGENEFTVLGKGEINWEKIISCLAINKYQNYLCIEPHLFPKVKKSKQCHKNLKKILESKGIPFH